MKIKSQPRSVTKWLTLALKSVIGTLGEFIWYSEIRLQADVNLPGSHCTASNVTKTSVRRYVGYMMVKDQCTTLYHGVYCYNGPVCEHLWVKWEQQYENDKVCERREWIITQRVKVFHDDIATTLHVTSITDCFDQRTTLRIETVQRNNSQWQSDIQVSSSWGHSATTASQPCSTTLQYLYDWHKGAATLNDNSTAASSQANIIEQ